VRTLGIIIGLLVILVVGGALTQQLFGDGGVLPVIQQTSSPSGSTAEVEGWQAEQFILLAGFLVVNLVGIGATIAALMWFLSRGVKQAEAETIALEEANSTN